MPASIRSICALSVFLVVLAACSEKQAETYTPRIAGGDPRQGKTAIRRLGCGACHAIPGIPGANGIVGPPLAKMARRAYVAGKLANTPENMIRWLLDPPRVNPSTAMPTMGLTESDARHIAAYLYTLE
ncbi:MAG: c-type cytochrome [Methylohalobius sp. ZOD2]